jgi:peptide/nickel transport system permease protein
MANVTASRADQAVAPRARRIESRGYITSSVRRLVADRVTVAALVALAIVVIVVLAAPLIYGWWGTDPYRQALTRRYEVPGVLHLAGTDDLGRDAFARVLIAGRVSLLMGATVALVSLAIGVPLGLACGYFGGWVDDAINAVIQTLVTTPTFFLLILLSVTLRPNLLTLAVILGLVGWMGTARLVRATTLSVRERDYVLAARTLGASDRRIAFQHVLPNVASLITVIAGFDVAGGILAESGLSYLGLGVQPPIASWGNMLTNSLENLSRAPWLVVAPGVAIFITTLAIFLIADGLRDAMDPRLK